MSDPRQSALQAIAKISDKPLDTLKPESELVADLGIDSARALELLIEIEEQLGVEISDEDAEDLNTVGDIVGYVERTAAG